MEVKNRDNERKRDAALLLLLRIMPEQAIEFKKHL